MRSARADRAASQRTRRDLRPTPEALQAACGKRVRDVIAPELRVLFCGINPSLYSAAVRRHFARPGNRFWPTLEGAGFTPRRLAPAEQRDLLKAGLGITNVVARATATAAELGPADYALGARRLKTKIERFRPRVVAVLGVGAYRAAFDRPKAGVGRRRETFGDTHVWVLPNPSGLNAHYGLPDLIRLFRRLRVFVDRL